MASSWVPLTLGLVAILSVSALWCQPACAEAPFLMLEKRIILDPGHGGSDFGAIGAGTMEKDVCFRFCNILADRLSGSFYTKLTRTGDYSVEICDRTATANHLKADLFISIHTGASWSREANFMAIFWHEDVRPQPQIGGAAWEPDDSRSAWDSVQTPYQASSKKMVRLLQEGFSSQNRTVMVQGAPVWVLKGVNMPAVLVELGYITHPIEEKMLTDPQELSRLVGAVEEAIHAFFAK